MNKPVKFIHINESIPEYSSNYEGWFVMDNKNKLFIGTSDGWIEITNSELSDYLTKEESEKLELVIASSLTDLNARVSTIEENEIYWNSKQDLITDLNDIRTKANNAYSKLGGHNVYSDVPSDAKFTDTIYDDTEIINRLDDVEEVTAYALTNLDLRISDVEENISSIDGKQDELVSGTNIKTIDGETILGSGNIETFKALEGVGDEETGWSIKENWSGAVLGENAKHAIAYGNGVEATGSYSISIGSHSEQNKNSASGSAAIAIGVNNTSTNTCSVAIGYGNTASGQISHAEGYGTTASGNFSHSEGNGTTAYYAAHAEGQTTTASGNCSHAEGENTIANGMRGHAEGNRSKASGTSSHAEGQDCEASGAVAHAEGLKSKATGQGSHVEGEHNIASGEGSHAEGIYNVAYGDYSHSSGMLTSATGEESCTVIGSWVDEISLTGNANTKTYTYNRLPESGFFVGQGIISNTIFTYITSIDEENSTITLNDTLSEDVQISNEPIQISGTIASGKYSFAARGIASGNSSWAVNRGNRAIGDSSFAAGDQNTTYNRGEASFGWGNISTKSSKTNEATILTVGNGGHHNTGSNQTNAFELKLNGDLYLPGIGGYTGNNYSASSSLQDVLNSKLDSTSLSNYYTKTQVDDLIDAIKQFDAVIADSLPTAEEGTLRKIYLIPNSGSDDNTRDEYITVFENSEYRWEKIGSTEISLEGYATEEYVDDAIDAISNDINEIDEVTASALTDLNTRVSSIENNGIQSPLTPGANIDITNDVISVTGINVPTKTSDLVNDSGFLTSHQSLSDYSTTAQMNSAISTATSDMATQTWVGNQGYLKSFTESDPLFSASAASGISSSDISNWNAKQDAISDLSTIITNASNGATAYTNLGGHTVAENVPSGAKFTDTVYDDTEITERVSQLETDINEIDEVTSAALTDLNTRVSSIENTGINIPTKTSDLVNDSGFLTSHQSLSDYSTTVQMNSAISTATSDMATQTWVEGKGYLTEHQSLSNYSTTTQMNSAITNAVSSKQDTLIGEYGVSGQNIKTINGESILGNGNITISGGNGGAEYTQGTGITISSNTISLSSDTITSLEKANTALQSHQSIKTINGNTITGTGNVSVGTVTSVGIIAGTGIEVTDSPVTTSGNITVSLPTTMVGSTTVNSISNIPVTHRAVLATISATNTLSFNSLPEDGFEVHVIIRNSGSSTITITLPSSGSYVCTSESTIYVAAGKYGEVNVITIGSTGYVHGISSI